MHDPDKRSAAPGTRPKDDHVTPETGGATDDTARPPEVHEDQVEARSRKTGDKDREKQRPPDEPGAEGERSARADEDTYD